MNYLYILKILEHSLKKLKHHIICVRRPAPLPVPQVTHVYAEDS